MSQRHGRQNTNGLVRIFYFRIAKQIANRLCLNVSNKLPDLRIDQSTD